jgi:uncharacterized protein YjlB
MNPEDPDQLTHVIFRDDGRFPNNSRLPLLLYSGAIVLNNSNTAQTAVTIENVFRQNSWVGSWRNGIYGRHHYHSTAHEVLGVYSGSASVQFGGEQGGKYEVKSGDVVVVPAGVAHICLQASSDFRVVGAYPRGQIWDMCYGTPDERPLTDRNIAGVPRPEDDPVYGKEGPLMKLWQK